MRDIHITAALSGAPAIVQRRSGKAPRPVQLSANGMLPFEILSFEKDCSDPTGIMEAGKVMARALAAVLEEEPRLTLAREFCSAVIRTYWFETQRSYRSVLPLPNHFGPHPGSELHEPAASLANILGCAAARVDPIKASYLIGVIYTAMLPAEARSRLGVYYTPPGLTRRLLEMASLAGVDWTSCRVLDPACGSGRPVDPARRRDRIRDTDEFSCR